MGHVDCNDVVTARRTLAPLECRELIAPLERDFLLTDIVFELYDYPNGTQSRACGFVWNAMPNQWSRKLLGGHVRDAGRQYHFETGLLCPRGSGLSVCTCWFVSEPTSTLWTVLSGHYCERSPWDVVLDVGALPTIDWTDAQAAEVIDAVDPTGQKDLTQDMGMSMPSRVLLGTARETIDRGEFWMDGPEGRFLVAPGRTGVMRTVGDKVSWTCGEQKGSSRCAEGTKLVVVRRSGNGRSIHWIFYGEQEAAGKVDDPRL
jgi:hypothetical protein